jgi:LysM domain
MSALGAIKAPLPSGSGASEAATMDFRDCRPRLRVVRHPLGPATAGLSFVAGGSGEPRSSSIPAGAEPRTTRPLMVSGTVLARPPAGVSGPVSARPRARVSRAPVRLTRRGRVVVTALVVTGLTIAALLVSLLVVPGGAQATSHGQARAGYAGMHRIVVQSGQTLWSIASAAEPTADVRLVVQEIMTANALTSATISAGQLLWVPR